jgi:DNA-binding beta-propeller fold protein YncE
VPSQRSILVFPVDGKGDIPPKRVLRGPKTRLSSPFRVAVDPKNNVVVVINDNNPPGIVIFDRTANGDVEPKAFITGPKTGFVRAQYVQVDPERKLIFVALSDVNSRYQTYTTRPEHIGIGIWRYSDDGDVAPQFAIRGGEVKLGRPRALDINPKDKEVYVTDMVNNAVFTYSLPEVFK